MENKVERYQLMVSEICKDHDCLNAKQRDALGETLAESERNYEAVVNFLYSADEIDLQTRLDLLDLL